MGVDFGGKRIGIAIMETDFGVTTPRSMIAATGTLSKDARVLVDLARKEEATTIVLGLPVNEGDERMAKVVKKLATEIEALGIDVGLVDESYSSLEATSAMKEAGMKGSQIRKMLDSEAACLILQRYMAQLS